MVFKIKLHLLLVLFPFIFVPFNSNNSCNNYLSYFFISFSSDCYHNPDVNDNITNIIQRHTNSSETHHVQTQDGYILGLFRIRRDNPRGVILFQHPFNFDARIWVTQYNDSVAFLYWRAGYDVWLGNTRGSLYSKKHVTLKPSDSDFWDHSFHELAYYDLHATVEYVKKTTGGSKIIYVGYCMGAISGLIYASFKPEDASKSIQIMITLAPVISYQDAHGPLMTAVAILYKLQPLREYLGIYSVGRYDIWYLRLLRFFYLFFPFKKLLPYTISLFFGWTPDEMDPNYANLMVSHFGSEASLKVVDHGHQMHLDNRFQVYSYGNDHNMKVYGSPKPSLYSLEAIKLPVFIVCSYDDSLSHYKDNERLFNSLPQEATIYGKLVVKGMNHFDYAYGKRRNEEVHNKVLQLLNSLCEDKSN